MLPPSLIMARVHVSTQIMLSFAQTNARYALHETCIATITPTSFAALKGSEEGQPLPKFRSLGFVVNNLRSHEEKEQVHALHIKVFVKDVQETGCHGAALKTS